ncbi:hypothetical protein J2T56_001263 [Natronobacillus azotifigens]|uniref:RES domain-containing protein n=1 Tax=Natronobacillus azotifigens TaxID=472978 RepID=A0A9J6RCD7_9BACI|nr:hypothetical protein [Natronobacillus azotifigens]MCZ0703022.1 hypothetical protein [Natronobacillus azotifigens]
MRFYDFDLVFQLNRMEKIFENNYKFVILKKAIIRLENKKNVNFLTKILYTLNNLFVVFNEALETENKKVFHDFCFKIYISYLGNFHMLLGNINEQFAKEYKKDFQSQIYDHWSGITENPDDDHRNFIDVFDDLHENCILKYPDVFVKNLGDLRHLYRAQRGRHFSDYERMVPKEEFVRGMNRWNPPGVAYLYLSYGDEIVDYSDSINTIEKTCFEELRLKQEEYVSSCKFYPENKNAKVLNLCYEDITFEDIEAEQDQLIQEQSKIKADEILNNKKGLNELINKQGKLNEELLWEVLKRESNFISKDLLNREAEKYIGRTFIKSIDEAVFKPVDQSEDPELSVYKPFHYLAEYLKRKGYAGILFRSTRMNMIELKGKNLVLFHNSDADYVEGSMNVYYYDGENYSVIQEE